MRARLRLAWRMRTYLWVQGRHLRSLPPDVRRFYRRAWWRALLRQEVAAFVGPATPEQVGTLLRLAHGAQQVVELGTGGAMTSVALALADPRRTVISYDTCAWPLQERHLRLVADCVQERIVLRRAPGEHGPQAGDPPAQLLFIDSSHTEEETFASFSAWQGALAPGATAVFHDYENSDFPGVARAVSRLGLEGRVVCGMFVASPAPGAGAAATGRD